MKKQLILLFFIISVNQSICARPIVNTDHSVTFFINNIISKRNASVALSLTENSKNIPTTTPATDTSAPAFSFPIRAPLSHPQTVWMPFMASLDAMEPGNLTLIDEELSGRYATGIPMVGKMQGIYVTCSTDNMVAVRAIFGGSKSEDSLRFFGEHSSLLPESHIAIVGGTGIYNGANGFAVVKEVDDDGSKESKLKFTVHIK